MTDSLVNTEMGGGVAAGSIGIFDSGFGGLSVLREIRKALPDSEDKSFAESLN